MTADSDLDLTYFATIQSNSPLFPEFLLFKNTDNNFKQAINCGLITED